jgi:hypothetical protein
MQLVPFPAMKPLQPSSLHILARAFGTDILYSSLPTLCIWNRILRRSSGDTTVRETAPATPPATKDARTGWAKVWRMRSRAVRSGARGCRHGISLHVSSCHVLDEYIHSLPVLSGRPWLRRVAMVAILWSDVLGGLTRRRQSSVATSHTQPAQTQFYEWSDGLLELNGEVIGSCSLGTLDSWRTRGSCRCG